MNIKNLLAGFDISSTGLKVQRIKMDAIADNIANSETTRTEEGGPYKRKVVVIQEKGPDFKTAFLSAMSKQDLLNNLNGAEVKEIKQVLGQPKLVYNPTHPDADANGYVRYPDINIISEMVELINVTRAYEANVTVMNAAKRMALQALEI